MALSPEEKAFQEYSARYAETRLDFGALRPATAPSAPSVSAAADAVTRHWAAQRPPLPDFSFEQKPAGIRAAVQMLFARAQPKSPLEEALQRMAAEGGRRTERSWLKPR